ncbi:MAG: sodium-translocating pyrophosphatase [Candidatus Omnitrophota bacterium]
MIGFLWLAPAGSILAILFAGYLTARILKEQEGTDRMKEIAAAVREGAMAYLKRQYAGIALFFAVMFFVLLYLALQGYLVIFVPFAFLTGGLFSGLSGFIGMKVATLSSARTANASRRSLNSGLQIAFSGGAVMGFVVVGLGLLDLSVWYFFLDWYYSNHSLPEGFSKIAAITSTMLCFGMGASSQALFARVGGGIFTKAADVGADLVGKIEAGIPEDDPRNPAVIADNVGDNVGDVAGMGADLYESYVGSIVATMALGAAAFGKLGMSLQSITIPMVMAAVGVFASVIGTFFVCSNEQADQGALLAALRKGIFTSAAIIAFATYFLIRFTLGSNFIGIYFAVFSGLLAGILIGLSTEYFTSSRYSPTKSVAEAALTGPATVIISGMSTGMLSTAIPVLVVCAAVLASYYLSGGAHDPEMGLYGVGISAVGLLSTLGITLATYAYGPIADNAGGNAQMSNLPPEVRQRTDALDSLGNTTAATGKGFAIGSAALTALALIAAYRDRILVFGASMDLSLMNPRVLVGVFIGGMLPFLFCALTMNAVGRTAGKIVIEVRRQFKEIKGLMEGRQKPDYARCVSIVTAAAQKEMILPSLLAILAPIAVGLLIGAEAQVGLLAGAMVSGFVLAVMMANSGGAWDNAKKYIEEGHYGAKGSNAHKASVVGDTVGDPFKDTAGPSLNILIKLMSMVSIVFATFIIKNALIK